MSFSNNEMTIADIDASGKLVRNARLGGDAKATAAQDPCRSALKCHQAYNRFNVSQGEKDDAHQPR
jgi:hypothetical protein